MSFKNTPPAVSTKLTFPCSECNFEAQSARQLSRHKAVTHTQNALKCVLCPFVTAYQTNLLRHRKDVHGICGSKGNKSCKFCGFVSEDNDTLIQHQIEYHQDILKSAQAKFAKELVSAGGEESVADFSANFESMSEDLLGNKSNNFPPIQQHIKKKSKIITNKQQHSFQQKHPPHKLYKNNSNTIADNDDDERTEFEEFWKAGFIDQYGDHSSYLGQNPMNNINSDIQNESLNTSSRSSTPKSQISHANMLNNNANSKTNHNNKDLPATRIRRQYNCSDCGFRTVNPREFLYHRRDMHGYKVKIVECPYCVYACQYVQKLQRHLLLVHKLTSVMNSTSDGLNPNNNSNNNNTNNNDLETLLAKRKYKKPSHSYHNDHNDNSIPMDQDDESGIQLNEDRQSDNEQFEPMNNFEMNLNEFSNNDLENDIDVHSSNNADEKKFLFNLECFICKIKFADAISAQKHFIRHHKQANYKSIVNVMSPNESVQCNDQQLAQGTTNQKKVFDSSAKNIHVCNFCGYKTRWISELERHVRVHSKEKPFKCPFCDFRSKWKGDLNRHIQRYHSNEQTIPDLESDTSANGNNGSISPGKQDDETLNESYMTNEDYEMSAMAYMDDNDDYGTTQTQHSNNENDMSDMDNDDIQTNGNTAKMYKCSYCDFMCSTASRFHVHYVQHLNTKPFQCSICGHRSNWEWDVTKHIKMKAQRDPNHERARPVLIHDSGKREYSRYDKFVIWVGQEEADITNENFNKIDFRAKRFKNEIEDGENENTYGMDSLLTPEVCFEVDGEINDALSNEQNFNESTMMVSSKRTFARSVIVSRHPESCGKPIKCSECEFGHHFARVMVAHMSSHTNAKPYSCKNCSFETNWREVIINHCVNMHKNCSTNEFEMRFRCVIDESSVCRIISMDELANIEANNEAMFIETTSTVDQPNSSLIEPNIYEEKAVIRCNLCPFITTNAKKMSIHCRFHNESKGSLRCKYCPYYVNNEDKLIRHQKLHQKLDSIISNRSSNSIENDISTDIGYAMTARIGGQQSRKRPSSSSNLISCPVCPFQTHNVQVLSDHMNTHQHNRNHHPDRAHSPDYPIAGEMNILEQTLTENEEFQVIANNSPSMSDYVNNNNDLIVTNNDYATENSVSLIDVNNMKNGHAKKFSYVCPDCPAAFKSPGDYKIHAVFHSSNYQHACPYCTYKARNKPQLCKHLYVHTAEYIAKRANSYPDGTKHLIENQDGAGHSAIHVSVINSNKNPTSESMSQNNKIHRPKSNKKTVRKHRTKFEFPMKPVKVKLNSEENGKQDIVFNNTDLMASQEFLETKEYLQRINSGIKNRCMYRCSKCPAVFTKVNTLIYHMTLHDQNARFTCDSCTYSTETEDNLSIHSLLHNLTESQTALGYNFNYNCHKCPAGFSKRTRLEKHLSLHGAKFNWKCHKCDYSVRYAATLVKHRALHLINPDFQAMEYGSNNVLSNDEDIINQNSMIRQNESIDNDDGTYQASQKPDLKLKLNLSQLRDDLPDDGTNLIHDSSSHHDDESESYDEINPAMLLEEGEV